MNVFMKHFKPILFTCFLLIPFSIFAQNNVPTGLLCDLLSHPESAVITHKNPDFGWIVNAGVKDDYQTAYQIQVASSLDLLQGGHADFWDSGKITSSQSINVRYG